MYFITKEKYVNIIKSNKIKNEAYAFIYDIFCIHK